MYLPHCRTLKREEAAEVEAEVEVVAAEAVAGRVEAVDPRGKSLANMTDSDPICFG